MKEFAPTPHPVYPIPTPEQAAQMGMARWREYHRKREELIAKAESDMFRYGYEPPVWKLADGQLAELRRLSPRGVITLGVLGGNRASKSKWAAKRVMQKLVEAPNRRAWCLHSTESSSVQSQQPYIWEVIPEEWKPTKTGRLRQGTTTNITYTQKGGFTEGTFVLPNRSQNWFKYYAMDVKTVEGVELDVAWFDELVTPDWIEAVQFRLLNRAGMSLITFTAVEGYTATVKELIQGAKVLQDEEAELLPVLGPKGPDGTSPLLGFERVPRVMVSRRPNTRIVFFHNKDNPWGNYEGLKETLAEAPREKILMRAYGVPTKSVGARFPKFREKVHVLPASRIPEEGTDYHFVDPCGGRNWFMGWFRVDVRGRVFMVMEWPCESCYVEGVGLPGPWAEPDGKKHDGKRGPAQQPFGFGLRRYKEEIERVEKGTKIKTFERRMDSRYGNSATVARERPTTLIEECAEIDLHFVPTPGENIDEGIDLINSMLDYDADRPLGMDNEPMLYIAEHCTNMIYALQEWTGLDGRHGASKDPVDVLRYALLSRIEFVGGDTLRVSGGGSY